MTYILNIWLEHIDQTNNARMFDNTELQDELIENDIDPAKIILRKQISQPP